MYAIIQDGGRQYKLEVGQVMDVDYRLEEQAGSGPTEFTPKEIRFDRVVAIRDGAAFLLGQPTIPAAYVVADVIEPILGPKVYIQKFRRRKNYRRRKGHRQLCLRVKVREIHTGENGGLSRAAEETVPA
ncbi:MAG: 50S ribosomal protein L21 [Thermogutta sp.]